MRATYSPSTLGMHHMSLRHGLEAVFGQPPAHCLTRQALVLGELDHGVGQQLQCPAGAARRRVGAGGRHQQGFLLARELALRPRPRVLAQRPFQIAFHEAPLGPVHGGAADRHGAGNLLVAAAGRPPPAIFGRA